MRGLISAALLLLSGAAHAQIITINENLATSSNTFYFDTNSPRLTLGATFYSGSVPSVVLSSTYNAVIGSCVLYATGSITCLGVNLSTAGAGPFVLRGGDTMTGELFNTTSSTFSLNLSSGIYFNTPKTGIVWADGSVSTTASSGGGACTNCFILNSSQTVSGTNTFSGTFILGAGATFQMLTPAPSTSTANAIYEGSFANVYANFPGTAGAIGFHINVTSITYPATGVYLVNFARPFASTSYGCLCSMEYNAIGASVLGAACYFADSTGAGGLASEVKTVSSIGLTVLSPSAAQEAPTAMTVQCSGTQ